MFDRLKRLFSREPKKPQAAGAVRMYNAAKVNRLTQDWVYSQLSANEEIRRGLKTVRDRARDLERNNDHMRRYLQMVEANVIGRGVRLNVKALDMAGAYDTMASDYLTRSFLRWADKSDGSGLLRWLDLQRLVVRTVARDGECLVRFRRGADLPDGMAMDVLEADYLDENHYGIADNGNRVIMGVEVDQYSRPIAYWLWANNPAEAGSGAAQWTGGKVRIPASDIVHVYRMERPAQLRGMPWCASAVQSLHMLEGYQEAELVAARVSSCKMGFYKIPPGEDFTPDDQGAQGPLTDASPGTFERLPTGWDFVQYDPQHPGANFDKFVKSILRSAAGGLNVAYNNFANDLDGVSYSSIRSGTLEERENWMVIQDWFINSFCRPVYSKWLEMALTTQAVKLPLAKIEKFRADTWTGRRWPWVDPQSDMAARETELRLGLTSKSQIVQEQGRDFDEVQKQRERDEEIEEKYNPDERATGATDTGATVALQDTALNGAQVQAAVEIVKSVVAGELPRDAAVSMIAEFFDIELSQADAIVGSAGNGFKAAAPATFDAGAQQ